MKKLLAIFLVLFALCLTSCAQAEQMENPTDEIINLLKLNDVKSGSPLTTVDTTKTDYVEILVANDAKASCFVYNVKFDENFKKNGSKIKELQIKALTFVTTIDKEQQALIMEEVYNETYGISKKVTTAFECEGFYHVTNVDKGLELYENGEDNVTLSVIYLPIRAKVCQEGEVTVDNYVMVPIYCAFNVYEKNTYTDTTFNGYTILGNEFVDAANYLKNKIE